MSKIKIIAFDADDTLWVNEYHYNNAENLFAQMMQCYSSPEEARLALLKKEKDNLPLLGYGSKPFIISMVECAIDLSKGSVTPGEITKIIEIGKNTIGQKIELLPNVEEVLKKLHEKYPLVLATKGDLKEQESKIERSGLAGYFTSVKIMSEKNRESYSQIIESHNIEASEFLMVGNSFKSDILPVLEIGGKAIYIPSEITWAHEIVEESEHPNLIKASALTPDLFNDELFKPTPHQSLITNH